MKVYIVMCGDGADKLPDSAWSTQQKAEERITALESVKYADPWSEPLEFEVDPS